MKIDEIIRNVRTKAGLSRTELADLLKVSEKSVRNWETGASTPDADVFLQIFFVCDEHLERSILKLKYPDLYGNSDIEVTDAVARQMLMTYLRNEMSDDIARKLLYCLIGEHGSNAGAQVNLCCAYNHFSMEDKYEICKFIVERYKLRKAQDRLVCLNGDAEPDLELLERVCQDVLKSIVK